MTGRVVVALATNVLTRGALIATLRYTSELVRKRFDVGPEHVSDWLAMVGDEDTLSGVKGLGKKSAIQLLTE
jgi:5'-3' exonuclease